MSESDPQHDSEAEIRSLLDRMARAARNQDVDAIISNYPPRVRAFEIGPPLQVVGSDAVRKTCEAGYAALDGPFHYELRHVRIVADEQIAFCHGIEHIKGTANGQDFEVWSRATYCFEKLDGQWRITHHHLSVPTEGGRALSDLKPT